VGAAAGEQVVVVRDVGQLEALLSRTFGIGLDVGRGKEPVALARLRLARALLGAAEANAASPPPDAASPPPGHRVPAAGRGVPAADIAAAEGLALHAAAFNGCPIRSST
jgi:hypothetical protein